jgi:glycosyltransferase involved in cell wall biosynthesis
MSAPRVSVIVPAHDAAGTLATAIHSVLEQSERDVEVIVVDDASSDATLAVAGELQARDGRVRLLRRERNGGPGAARNTALQVARGAWVALLDADDSMAPNRLAWLMAIAEREAADIVSDNLLLVDGPTGAALSTAWRGQTLAAATWLDTATFIRHNRFDRVGLTYGYMKPIVRRAFVDRHRLAYSERLRIGEDFHFFLDCLLAGARWRLVGDALYRYTLRPASTSRQLDAEALRQLLDVSRSHYGRNGRRQDLTLPIRAALTSREKSIERFLIHAELISAFHAGELGRMVAGLVREPAVLPIFARACREAVLKRLGLMQRHRVSV